MQAAGLSQIVDIAAGAYHSLAMADTVTTSHTYDELNRLTSASSTDGHSDTRVYDALGNQTSVTVNGVQSTATNNAANELTAFGGRPTATTTTATV